MEQAVEEAEKELDQQNHSSTTSSSPNFHVFVGRSFGNPKFQIRMQSFSI
jgi:hypothetical protein